MINLVFRFDDPSPATDHDLEKAILSRFARHGIPVTVAVTPFSRCGQEIKPYTRAQAAHLLEANRKGMVQIALHGYLHEERTRDLKGRPSEFFGVPRLQQEFMLREGAEQLTGLFGRPLEGFVPPFNSHDAVTEDILHSLGFTHLSAGWSVPTDSHDQLTAIPRTCQLSHLRAAVEEARRIEPLTPLIVVVLHHHDFEECDRARSMIDLRHFEQLVAWTSAQPRIRFQTLESVKRWLHPSDCLGRLRKYGWKSDMHWRLQAFVPRYCFTIHPIRELLWGSITYMQHSADKTSVGANQ